MVDGWIEVPDRPGLGAEPLEDVLAEVTEDVEVLRAR